MVLVWEAGRGDGGVSLWGYRLLVSYGGIIGVSAVGVGRDGWSVGN